MIGAKEKHGVDIGDHAIAENIVPCWECRYCLRGNYNMCEYASVPVLVASPVL